MSTQPSVAVTSSARPPKMTLRQRLLVNGVVDGKSIAQAGRDAGYRSRANAHDSFRDAKAKLPALLQKHGLDADTILDRLRDKLDATKTVTASAFGEITDSIEVADNPTQIKAIEIAVELHGFTGRDSGTSIGTVNILWAGEAPPWARPTAGQPDDTVPHGNSNATVTEPLPNSIQSPLSTLEGTGSGPGLPTPTHPDTLAKRIVAKKKRRPRLPIYRGDK